MEIRSLLFENLSTKQIIFKNTFWLYLSSIVSRLLKFFLVVYAARLLGPAQYGTFNYAIYLVGLFFMFADLGLSPVLIREHQKEEIDKKKLISTTFWLKTCLVLAGAAVAAVSYFFTQDELVRNIYLILLLMAALNNLKEFFISLARAHNRMEYEGFTSIVEGVLTTSIGLFYLFKTHSLLYLALAYLFGSTVSLLFIIFQTYKYLPGLKFFGFDYARQLLIFSLPFAFGSVIGVFLSTDVLMLKWLGNAEVVGQYSVALRIVQLLFMISGIFCTALYPIFSGFTNNKDKITSLLKTAISYMLMVGLPLFFGGLILADRLILGFFGNDYQLGVLAFKVLVLFIPFYYLTQILDTILLAMNYQVQNMIITAIAAIVNVILNFILISRFSLIGAAAATVSSQIINLLLTYLLTKKILRSKFIDSTASFRFGLASVAMALLLYLLQPLQIATWILITAGIVFYFGLLLLFRENHLVALTDIFTKRCVA